MAGKGPSLASIIFKFVVGTLLLVMLYYVVAYVVPMFEGASSGGVPGVQGSVGVVAGGFYQPETVEVSNEDVVLAVLDRINEIRSLHGIPPLTLYSMGVAEARAEDMVENRYFGHCRPDGTPFFAVYSEMGGIYYPEENIGLTVATRGILQVDLVSEALSHIDRMVYNDSASDWGHRDSLLDPTNNIVDIAVRYDSKMMILEIIPQKAWINWTSPPIYENGRVVLEGVVALEGSKLESIVVYRYEKPKVIQWPQRSGVLFTCETLDPGRPVAVVVPGPYYSSSVDTIVAEEWSVSGDLFRVVFYYDPPPGDEAIYYVVLWIDNTLGVEHPYDKERYREAIPALLLVLGEGG